MERIQPIVMGTTVLGELIWGEIEMARWQRIMFPRRYTGDFGQFWMKLQAYQKLDREIDSPNIGGFAAFVPGELAEKYRPKHHKGD